MITKSDPPCCDGLKKKLAEESQRLAQSGEVVTKFSLFLAVLPEIEKLTIFDVPHVQLRAALEDAGLPLSMDLFRVYLHRARHWSQRQIDKQDRKLQRIKDRYASKATKKTGFAKANQAGEANGSLPLAPKSVGGEQGGKLIMPMPNQPYKKPETFLWQNNPNKQEPKQ